MSISYHRALLTCCLYTYSLQAIISYVYNLKIAETTRRNTTQSDAIHPSLISLLGVSTLRTKYNGLKEEAAGALGTYIYMQPDWYLRADGAAAHIRYKYEGLTIARNQTDDILFSGGYGVGIGSTGRITLSGLVGIPTHADRSLVLPQFGTGHVGLGTQVDASIHLDGNRADHLIQGAARIIHFFPRSSRLATDYGPIALTSYPGDLLDLFMGYQISIRKHALEMGFNPSFLFHAGTSSPLTAALFDHIYIRPSFYANYRYIFRAWSFPMALGIGASYGFDVIQSPFNTRRSTTFWAGTGLLF